MNIVIENDSITGRICIRSADDKFRFALGEPKHDWKNLLFVGMNPSKAGLTNNDMTVRKIMGFAKNENSGWLLCNLYPFRATFPDDLPKEISQSDLELNLQFINDMISVHRITKVVCCWGGSIEPYKLLKDARRFFYENISKNEKITLHQLGSLTANNNPKHPSRIAYSEPINPLGYHDRNGFYGVSSLNHWSKL